MTDGVTHVERLVAGFIAEYEDLCRRHGCMVIMAEPDGEEGPDEYCVFAVGCFNDATFLDQALEEMRIEPPRMVEEFEEDEA